MKAVVLAAAAASMLVQTAYAEGMYSKNSPVLQVDAKNYDRLIAKSNYPSIVEFYAPWCGHCKNLKPAYEKAAKSLSGLAKVAAVNCDDESNKAFCGSMGVQGFPTLKIVKPGKKPGKPSVEEYQGQRSAKAIVDTMVDKIPNHVQRVSDKGLEEWLAKGNDTAKAVLFTDKGTTSALLRSLAIDFLGSISVAQIRDKEKNAVDLFGVSKFPTLLLLPGGSKDALVYDGEMKKEAMLTFLSQIAPPNPDPAPAAASPSSKPESSSTDKKSASSASSAFSKASASHASAESSANAATATTETLEEASPPTESPDPNIVTDDTQKPVAIPQGPPMLEMLETEAALNKACLAKKSHTCILALLPTRPNPEEDPLLPLTARTALASLGHVSSKHHTKGQKGGLFPFYAVPAANEGAKKLRDALGLKGDADVELVATNAKRGWFKRFEGSDYGMDAVEAWVDAIRMGEGKKGTLPAGVVVEEVAEEVPSEEAEPVKVKIEDLKSGMGDLPVEIEVKEVHDEL
ncbi:hypothetical protein H2201_000856 [Coniosporium apollinis]|uniref:protein disulfide-isomerase n=1 Tax=Coniosporium apollinis TaxID=61459 RepID=A0ABQ9P349_9PEZI|nr:hypothetical protein H2201_000856 [Coniosporium apollinis]